MTRCVVCCFRQVVWWRWQLLCIWGEWIQQTSGQIDSASDHHRAGADCSAQVYRTKENGTDCENHSRLWGPVVLGYPWRLLVYICWSKCNVLRAALSLCLFAGWRFRADAADVEFVEKVARWLTNCQVQIKSEVASCNSQSDLIDQSIDRLEQFTTPSHVSHVIIIWYCVEFQFYSLVCRFSVNVWVICANVL